MLTTYKALLRGNRLEWTTEAPSAAIPEIAIPVHVTILEEVDMPRADVTRGQHMAAALEQLAAIHAFVEITDPVAWERDLRQDRELLDRDI